MNAPYAPDTDEVRAKFADWYSIYGYRDIAEGWFDRWIAKVKAEARRQGQEDGWLRGYQLGATHAHESAPHAPDRPPNPYRFEADQ